MLNTELRQTSLSPITFGNHTDSDLFEQIRLYKKGSPCLHTVWVLDKPGKPGMKWEK
jgi:hypothetical protein